MLYLFAIPLLCVVVGIVLPNISETFEKSDL